MGAASPTEDKKGKPYFLTIFPANYVPGGDKAASGVKDGEG